MKITLIRHAETTANVNNILAGWTDVDLTQNGEETVKHYASKMIYPSGQHYYCSDLVRCKKTFEYIYDGITPVYSKKFREISFGIHENKSYDEIDTKTFFYKWLQHGMDVEEGESFIKFKSRVKQGIEEIYSKLKGSNTEHAILVCHSGYIRAALHLFVDDEKPFFSWDVPNALGYTLTFNRDKKHLECIQYSKVSVSE